MVLRALLLLSESYLRHDQPLRAYSAIRLHLGASPLWEADPELRFLLAKACFLLRKYDEAEEALLVRTLARFR